MKFLDLFAGIGGFHSGMEKAGHKCVSYVEIDKFARASYQSIYKTEGLYTANDIRTVRASELPKADIWCFGFPCQDISVAGKQKGFAGARSSLFFATTRLIRDLKQEDRPSYLVIENVKNLLSINAGFDFLKLQIELDEIGYDCEWDVLDTAEILPQHRERVYIVGHFRGRSTRKVFPIVRSSREIDNGSNTVNTITTRYGEAQGAGAYIGESKSPKIVVNPHGFNKGGVKSISPTVTAGSYKDNTFVVPCLTPNRLKKRQNGRRFKNNGEPMFTLNTQDRNGIAKRFKKHLRIRKLTPLECWRLQGFTDEQFHKAEKVNSNSQLYKQAGNSVSVPVVYSIAEKLGFKEVTS